MSQDLHAEITRLRSTLISTAAGLVAALRIIHEDQPDHPELGWLQQKYDRAMKALGVECDPRYRAAKYFSGRQFRFSVTPEQRVREERGAAVKRFNAVHAFLSTIIIIVTIAVVGLIILQARECSYRGGHFLRGAFWYECVVVSK